MLIQGTTSSVFGCGVPLFIMLTGYLNINKSVSRKYYSGIWRVLAAYLFFSVLTLIFRHYILNEPISPMFAIKSILNFTSFMYGWYIEMWIGLFLLVPFLNILYKGIPTKAHKHVLIITLSFLTFIPVFTNRYGQHLLPAFWTSLYPVAFYFIGSYIREYQPSVSKWCAAGITWFKQRYFIDQSSFGIYFFIIVPIIFLCAFLLSLVKRMLFSVPGAVRFR